MSMISFRAKIVRAGLWEIVVLPKEASVKLPSRGIVMVEGTVDGKHFQSELEPDGKGSHWFRVDGKIGDTVAVVIESIDKWPEPTVAADLKNALADNLTANKLWKEVTPMARWDWIRWINSTKNSQTRKKRIEVAMSKLRSGKRRPCCFNRTECTVPEVSEKGVLLIK